MKLTEIVKLSEPFQKWTRGKIPAQTRAARGNSTQIRMWCGHPRSAIVRDDRGIEVCGRCSGLL